MGEKEILADVVAVSAKEYKKLVEAQVRIEIFADYVRAEKYSIGRENCAALLGFELEEDEDAGD